MDRRLQRFQASLIRRSSVSTSSIGTSKTPSTGLSNATIITIVAVVVFSLTSIALIAFFIRHRFRMLARGNQQYPFAAATGWGPRYQNRYQAVNGYEMAPHAPSPPPPAYTESAAHRYERRGLDGGGLGMSSASGVNGGGGLGGGMSGGSIN